MKRVQREIAVASTDERLGEIEDRSEVREKRNR